MRKAAASRSTRLPGSIGNGARLERLNFLGDTSAKSMREAAGLMVNYLYELRFIEANHEAFANHSTIKSRLECGRAPTAEAPWPG